jgi:tetratricopeptide (TPR) repeat protein
MVSFQWTVPDFLKERRMGRAVFVGVAVVLCLGVWVQAGESRLAVANKLINARQYDDAIAVCKEPAVAALGIDAQVCIVRANILAGRDSEADAEWQKMLSDNAGDIGFPDAVSAVAEAHYRTGNIVAAKGLFLLAATKGAGTDAGAMAVVGLAKVAVYQGNRDAVQGYADNLVNIYSGRDVLASAIPSIAGEYKRQGRRADAMNLLEWAADNVQGIARLRIMVNTVCMHIDDNDGKAEAMIETMKQEAEGKAEIALGLMPVASKYLDRYDVSKAASLFGWIRGQQGQAIPTERSAVSKSAFYADLTSMMLDIQEGSDIITSSEAFCARYADWPELPDAVLNFSGQYLAKRLQETGGNADANDRFVRKATELLEKYVVAKDKTTRKKASGYYIIGGNYEILGDYVTAARTYELAVETDPDFKNAWQYLLRAARCYEKLVQDGTVKQGDGEDSIRRCFERIMARNPAYPGEIRQISEKWLREHKK